MTQRRVRKEPLVDIDVELFLVAIKAKAVADDVTLHSVAWTLDISTSTFTRISYAVDEIAPDYRPNLRTYLTLCWWLEVSPATFLVTPERRPRYVTPPSSAKVSVELAPTTAP